MVSPKIQPQACWEFEGEILVLHHPTTISSRYQAMGKQVIKFILLKLNFNSIFIFSTLWEYQTNCINFNNVSRLFKDR